ncbi:Kelch repeat-containing protein [Chitinophaga cymbidii]|uniref:Galactose oxidase n=1 Tax=Chitinophaga cymbidii TaxID=1096750 RepID=A0A512RL43_9BACT|nr:galactose oxidase [Chitinophaga cymbidii]GEP96411.1 hypothetical protein CCY01nite_26710 [Chitinophaga cymbidii]
MQNARHYCWILAGLLAACSNNDDDDDFIGNWIERSELAGKPRSEAVAFVINDTAYVGTGFDGTDYRRDFWKYANNGGWITQIAELPAAAAARSSAVAFVIDNIAYVGTGFDRYNELNDFWAYSPATGQWVEKARLVDPNPSIDLSRKDAVSFVLKGKGYIACGNDGGALKDVWMYDPAADKWTSKNTFGGAKRTDAVAFVIGERAYICTGTNNSELKNDMWEYNPDTDIWTEKRKISDATDEDFDNDYDVPRSGAVGFVLNNKGYVATGTKGGLSLQTWEYNAVDDTWTRRTDFEGPARTAAVAFVLGGKAYVCAGRTSSLPLDDLYQFDPLAAYDEND